MNFNIAALETQVALYPEQIARVLKDLHHVYVSEQGVEAQIVKTMRPWIKEVLNPKAANVKTIRILIAEVVRARKDANLETF